MNSSTVRITQKAIKEASPGDVPKNTDVRGLQVRVFDGSAAFYLYYRTRSGAQRKPKLADVQKMYTASKGRPIMANRALAHCSSLMKFAKHTAGARAENSNPCRVIERFKEVGRGG